MNKLFIRLATTATTTTAMIHSNPSEIETLEMHIDAGLIRHSLSLSAPQVEYAFAGELRLWP